MINLEQVLIATGFRNGELKEEIKSGAEYIEEACKKISKDKRTIKEYVSEAIYDAITSWAKNYSERTMGIHYRNEKVKEYYKAKGGVKTEGSVGFDLVTAEDATIPAKQWRNIDLGVILNPAPGIFAGIVPRSSTFKKYSIDLPNSVGVIDIDYIGKDDYCSFPARNDSYKEVFIPAGTPIAQVLLLPRIPFVVEEFTPQEKSRGGFGSTDK